MIDLKIDSDVEAFTRWLSKAQKQRIPMALAKALTFTAKDAQAEIMDAIPKRFNNRVKWWYPRQPTGIRVKAANVKTGVFESMVYTQAHFGDLQEDGGVKIPYRGKGFLIPTTAAPAYARKATGSKKLLAGKRVLRWGGKADGSPIYTMDSGKRGVFRRTSKKRLPIQLVYNYRTSAPIRPRFGFRKQAHDFGVANFQKKFMRIAKKELRKR